MQQLRAEVLFEFGDLPANGREQQLKAFAAAVRPPFRL